MGTDKDSQPNAFITTTKDDLFLIRQCTFADLEKVKEVNEKELPEDYAYQTVDIAALGKAVGASSFTVTQPGEIQNVIRQALIERRPTVIDVRVDPNASLPVGARICSNNSIKKA